MMDVIIIGAGVVGCAIARELSRHEGEFMVLEKAADVCEGTSKANSAIIHGGYDAAPGTAKARFNVRGNAMMDVLSKDLDIPFRRIGSLVIQTRSQEKEALLSLLNRGGRNGVKDLRILEKDELFSMEPNLSEDAERALFCASGSIVCPFHMTIALAENAVQNGTAFSLSTRVLSVKRKDSCYVVETDRGEFETRAVINAAGVWSDVFHNQVSEKKLSIIPRKGEYLLFDKSAGSHVSHIIFQLPGKMGKGVLVTPTIHGNLLVGPTAMEIPDPEGVNTTSEGLAELKERAMQSIRDLPFSSVITSFAGVRAHEAGGDFVVGEAVDAPGFFDAAGIESPGLSSAPAIGEYLAGLVAKRLSLPEKKNFISTRKGIRNPSSLSMEERNLLIREKPAYGNMICRCEMISEGEILDAIHRPLGAKSLDAVKRRTRAGMGRCQGGFCSPRVMELLERELSTDALSLTKAGGGSFLLTGRNKDDMGKEASHETT